MNDTQQTFQPQIDDRGRVQAGGVTLGELHPGGQIIIPDRYTRRCHARGTDVVPIDLVELMQEIIRYYQAI